MKLTSCAALIFILANFAPGSSGFDVAGSSKNSNEDDDKTKLTDLDRDCMFITFEHLRLEDLFAVAQIDDKLSEVAADVFRRKYSHLEILIEYSYDFLRIPGIDITRDTYKKINEKLLLLPKETPTFEIAKSQLKLRDYHSIWFIFKHFGHVIKKCKMEDYRAPNLQIELMAKLISEYSSESLVDIVFHCSPDQVLKYITKPLIKVETMTLEFGLWGIGSFRLNEKLPALRRLYLYDITEGNLATFDYHLPHLEHLTLSGYCGTDIPGVISKNPQIRSIELSKIKPNLLREINTQLPQLDKLTLSYFDLRNGSIQFERVTTYEFRYGNGKLDGRTLTPPNLHFPKLQNVSLEFNTKCLADYITFLNQHNHLTSLFLTVFDLVDQQFHQLTANLTNLVELTLEYGPFDGEENLNTIAIVEFLRSHDKVKQLNVIDFSKNHRAELETQLKEEWDTETSGDSLHFKRNKNTE